MNFGDIRAIANTAKTLHKKSAREESGLFLIEGRREIELAEKHGIEIICVLDKTNTSSKNMERISYCGEAVAVAKMSRRSLKGYSAPENPLIVVLDSLEKPGNIGAILRTADAAGVSAVFICGGCDIFNPNLIRASLGAVFCLPVFCVPRQEAAGWLAENKVNIIAASPGAAVNCFEYSFPAAAGIIVGSEAHGVSQFWTDKAGDVISIPMTGEVNSLNVSVSAAILIYRALGRVVKSHDVM